MTVTTSVGLHSQLKKYYIDYVNDLTKRRDEAIAAGVVFTEQEEMDIEAELVGYQLMIDNGPIKPYIEKVDSLFDWSSLRPRIEKAIHLKETDSMTYLREAFLPEEVKA